jgi:hypothetical protein
MSIVYKTVYFMYYSKHPDTLCVYAVYSSRPLRTGIAMCKASIHASIASFSVYVSGALLVLELST